MRLLLLLLLIGLGGVSARAAEPESMLQMQWAAGAGISAFVDLDRRHEVTGVGRHIAETTAAGVAWQAGGFKAAVSAGRLAYDYTGAGTGAARLASFAVSYEIATTTGGGTFSLELRQSRLWEGESQLDITSARLGWSLRF